MAALWPAVPPRAAGAAAAIVLTAANLFGIKKAGMVNAAVVAVSVSVLVAFVIAGIPAFDSANLTPFAPAGLRGVLESAGLLFFAYTGYARVATLGEEVHDPRRTIPRAIALALGASVVLYLAVGMVAVGTIGAEAMAATTGPLQRAAGKFPFKAMPQVVGVGAVTAMLAVLLSQVFGISRMLFAMARRRDLPRLFDHLHSAYAVPDRAVLFTGAVIVAVAWAGTLKWGIGAATFTILIYYTITNLAALRMPREQKLYPDWIAATGLAFCVVLALSLSKATIVAGAALLGIGFALPGLDEAPRARR